MMEQVFAGRADGYDDPMEKANIHRLGYPAARARVMIVKPAYHIRERQPVSSARRLTATALHVVIRVMLVAAGMTALFEAAVRGAH